MQKQIHFFHLNEQNQKNIEKDKYKINIIVC